ncbi:MAG: VWA domain-containing protein [Chitinophagaceae bacterium]|nr:MAG: VWA domain-containing protein [Chitinophagaceae bacterium]
MNKLLAAGLLSAVLLCHACNEGTQGEKYSGDSTQDLRLFEPGNKDEAQQPEVAATEGYAPITENTFRRVSDNPLSTFSIDVDGASYSNVRRMLQDGYLPPAGAVRIEEMINYFRYDYAAPANNEPFAIHTEMSTAPWNKKHQLVMVGLQGKRISTDNLPPANLVFLVDVSGSMESADKLPLVKSALHLLTDQLRSQDRVSLVVYAGSAGLVLEPTPGNEKTTINDAIDRLEAGGSTAGAAGLQLAYQTARNYFRKEGTNRVLICTDGDFNMGESSDDAMERLIEKERESGVFLSVLGFGTGNYQDAKMQLLADKGNGNHSYIDGLSEARKVLATEFGGTVFTIAKDVKLQVEFNPASVQAYRLIGYENRMLAKEDFNDDRKDAGELGSGHTVTALYEVIPAGIESEFTEGTGVDALKYSTQKTVSPAPGNEIMTVKFRYKDPGGSVSKLITHPVQRDFRDIESATDNFRFAAAVAEFGMLLRNSAFRSAATYPHVLSLARSARGNDAEGYRDEFRQLVEKAAKLSLEKEMASIEKNEEVKPVQLAAGEK